ncbi:MAG: tRNA1(Val) (adenine(37)-N6)-methyltransferase [Lachnospiraceae bacterium]|nr:tRNA1(Val) (adenine(37)-N6)-methyltransferase [Lachnospiraceae bacterium]
MEVKILPGERLDDLQRNGYKIIQNERLFCFGMDAVLLSAFADAKEGERLLDLGTGTGVIPILMEARTAGREFVGLEISTLSADMASRSVLYNRLEGKVRIIQGDIKEADRIFPPASFDVVISNPPYMTAKHGLVNPDPDKAAARHEIFCTLEDVVSQAARALRPGGRFYLVHRPFRMAEIIRVLSRYKLEPKRIRMVYPFVDKEPNMILIEAVRGGKPRVTVEPPLIVYEKPGIYTEEVRVLYDMQQEKDRK